MKGEAMPYAKGARKIALNLLITIVLGLAYFYLKLPAINLHDTSFYMFFFTLSLIYIIAAVVTQGIFREQDREAIKRSLKHNCLVPIIICVALLGFVIIGGILSSVLFRSRAYRRLITVEPGDFASEVTEISYSEIPMLDAASAEKLGDRKLGELSDMVSQFEVTSDYTQINFRDRPVRVTPLMYGDAIKWLNNRGKGLPAYVVIDMVTQAVDVVRLDEGMKYSKSEYFFRNVDRRLRFLYPTFMFDTPSFEIDEDGTPFWVCPRIVKTIGLFGGTDIKGAVLMNAITGECEYYEDAPTWVDRVYSAELIMEQYDYYGKYIKGFFNSIIGQKEVTVTTEGYNYIALKDDVYMYTGITSVGTDESNVGFILSNLRTKETRYYACAGAEEYSAMSSAEGVVQHLGYSATFPLLLNIYGQPTYFLALKDNAGLVKMYAMVNVQQYQIVATGSSVSECEAAYRKLLTQNNITGNAGESGNVTEGVITEIKEAVIDGNTRYYFRLDEGGSYYVVSANDNELAVILNVGDRVKISWTGEGEMLTVLTMERA
jgi:hypothetical protein